MTLSTITITFRQCEDATWSLNVDKNILNEKRDATKNPQKYERQSSKSAFHRRHKYDLNGRLPQANARQILELA